MASGKKLSPEQLFAIENEILSLLAKRKNILRELTQSSTTETPMYWDKSLENELLQKLSHRGKELGLDTYFISQIFHEIYEHSQRIQREVLKLSTDENDAPNNQIVVAFQGVEGAYSHLVGQKYFASQLDSLVFSGLPTFQAIIEAVEKGGADYAILPIENTNAGSINEAYDLLNKTRLSIIGEDVWHVKHCLCAIDDIPLARIRHIYSHPQALTQCSNFLSSLTQCTVESFVDTAMAVQKVKHDEDLAEAAIASEQAAERYGLKIIKRNIANTRENYTRFVIIARERVEYDQRIRCKTSLIFATKHIEGALVNCLNILARNHLNMTKLESRPRINIPWEHLFYVDFEGNLNQDSVKKALQELTAEVSYMKVLGSYPAKIASSNTATTGEVHSNIETETAALPDKMPALPKAKLDVPEKKAYRLASRAYKKANTQIKVGKTVIGGDDFVVIAGPCSVESKEQVMACSREISKQGGHILRGGVFKPRTSPYSFQGLGYEGLDYLSEAGRKYDLPIITEILQPEDVEKIAESTDILQIGARNMQNFPLLREVGRINRPVLLKRGMMASIDELLSAAEYILSQGNQQVILCERGIRTFETATRNTLDLSAVPVIKHYSHLPVIVDPSHASGDWRWVVPLVEASLAVGADGVMVEIHPEPEKALSDGAQSLKFDTFEVMMQRLKKMEKALKF
ncbi:bifunctional 3-deoxy-7-phosphoheptulonate synthase/chorismate mutase [bacterium]|nr:bifunctional 3-deoxy-7-phosphoheptulonate synthase/chorismate mutase [bacterium]